MSGTTSETVNRPTFRSLKFFNIIIESRRYASIFLPQHNIAVAVRLIKQITELIV